MCKEKARSILNNTPLFIISLVALMIRNVIMLPEKDFGSIIGQILLALY